MKFRKVFFWLHLVCGLVVGAVVAVMSFTGAVLAFEHEIVAWAERDVRRVAVPEDGRAHLSLDELAARVGAAEPSLRSATVTLLNDPGAAVQFSSGREAGVFVDPYSGEVRNHASSRTSAFMRVMLSWHRFLGLDGDNRQAGKMVNGVSNLAFLLLAVTGLYLWWPRSWSWRGFRAIALLNWRLVGKARDFNWHNAIGLWTAPVLIVLTLTAVPISFRWGNNLVYQLVGEEPPVRGGPPQATGSAIEITRPSADARPLGYDAIADRARGLFPTWEQITMRRGGDGRERRGREAGREEGERAGDDGRAKREMPLTVTIREAGTWPRTGTTTLTLDPYTGDILRHEAFGDLSAGRRLRSWTRFLHTGQALGWGGQLAAGLGCIGGLFLVYTGFALSWRRFLRRGGSARPGS